MQPRPCCVHCKWGSIKWGIERKVEKDRLKRSNRYSLKLGNMHLISEHTVIVHATGWMFFIVLIIIYAIAFLTSAHFWWLNAATAIFSPYNPTLSSLFIWSAKASACAAYPTVDGTISFFSIFFKRRSTCRFNIPYEWFCIMSTCKLFPWK